MAFLAASSPARCAAKAVALREPLNPTCPELLVAITSPAGSVKATVVLLNVAET